MGLIKDLIGGGIKGIGDAVSGVIDSINAPKEERERAAQAIQAEINRHAEVLLNASTDLEKSYLQDVQDSRGANAKIQESANASWLSKNVGYMLDLFVMTIWAAMTFYIAAKYLNLISSAPGVDFSGIWGLYATVTSMATIVLSWHRGSSQGSQNKQATIDVLMKRAA